MQRFQSFHPEAMSVGYTRVLDRCSCIAKVLKSLESSAQFKKHAENQAMCLQSMIRGNDVTDDECAQLSVRVTELGFPPDIVCSLMESLHDCHGKRHGSKSNVRLQNWEAFSDYLPQSRWEQIQDASSLEALKMILVDAIRLGLRHPSCPTFGMLASVYSIHEIGAQAAMTLTRTEKYTKVSLVKSTFRSMVANKSEPPVYVVRLPHMVSQFVEEYPSLATPFYMGDVAVDYPLDACFLKIVCDGMPLRVRRGVQDKHVGAMVEGNSIVPQGGGSNVNICDLMQTVMNLMTKLSSPREGQINYLNREPLKTAVGRGPQNGIAKRVIEDTRVAGQGHETAPLEDAEASATKEEGAKGTEMASRKLRKQMKKERRLKKKKKRASILESSGAPAEESSAATVKSRSSTASLLGGLLQREADKKLEAAEKKKKEAADKKMAAGIAAKDVKVKGGAILKKPAGVLKRPAAAIKCKIPLGCSKCRYLVNGCGECRLKALKALG